jgi:hypothetical protein
VRLHAAVLTHEVTRKTTIDVALPQLDFRSQSVNQAFAKVSAEPSGSGILLYDATGADVVSVRNKYRSSLAVAISAVAGSIDASKRRDLRVHSTDGTWSYELLFAKSAMGREELEAATRPFINQYMSGQFTGETSLSLWYRQLDDAVESRLHNGPERFGDVCAALEVTLPVETIGAWLTRVENVASASKAMSRAIQRSLKDTVRFQFLTDIARLHTIGTSAALLAWSSIPPVNAIRVNGGTVTDEGGPEVFWDPRDRVERAAMLQHPVTIANLRAALAPLRLRLEEAGRHDDVQFYEDDQAGTLVATALSSGGFLLDNLLAFERAIAVRAAAALADVQAFLAAANVSPSQAVVRLADFAADITTAFNKLAGETVFAGLSFRALSQSVFVEAARALQPSLAAKPRAMLTLSVLQPQRTFTLAEFLNGAVPPADDVLLAERLVTPF